MIPIGPMSDARLEATRGELVRLTLGGGPERSELVMSALAKGFYFTDRHNIKKTQRRRKRRR